MLPEKIFHQLLKDKFRVTGQELHGYAAKAKKLNKPLEQYLTDEAIVDEVELYTAAAKKFGVPFIALRGKEIKKEVLLSEFHNGQHNGKAYDIEKELELAPQRKIWVGIKK